jgi:5-dehydro-2-deoxygluconokinase
MNLGYDKPLYVLPFDHRGTFKKQMFGWEGTLSPEQTAAISEVKQVIYDGFKEAIASGVPKEHAGILVDDIFGSAILRDAAAQGYSTACTVEKSGLSEFQFEYGNDFGKHIDQFNPTFAKVLVRYNTGGDREMNRRQASRLRELSEFLHSTGRKCKYMFELLVPPEPAQLDDLDDDRRAYDTLLRPHLMVQAIEELQDAGVEPDVWKIEGIDRAEDCEKVVKAVRRNARDKVGCIVLGRGEGNDKVREWLVTAASVPGFIGFAVGRTSFWDPLMDWKDKKISRDAAVSEISDRFRQWVDIFEQARQRRTAA